MRGAPPGASTAAPVAGTHVTDSGGPASRFRACRHRHVLVPFENAAWFGFAVVLGLGFLVFVARRSVMRRLVNPHHFDRREILLGEFRGLEFVASAFTGRPFLFG